VRRAFLWLGVTAALALAGCGGGSGMSLVSGSSGSSSSGGSSSGSSGAANAVTVTVDGGPASVPDALFTSVTVCVSGTSTCQTIDHIQIDTGSSGLRIIGSVLTLALTQQTSSGTPVAECTIFGDGYSWGPVKLADVKIGGETAANIPVQVMGDAAYPTSTVPAECQNNAPPSPNNPENTVQNFGANGVLGVGSFVDDCGPFCASGAQTANYYTCPTPSSCQDATQAEASQVSNPVAFFATDNNGVVIKLPALASAVALSATGTMIFGIGTQTNNALGMASIYTVDASQGYLSTLFGASTLADSFLDTGSTALFFDDNIATCSNSDTVAPGYFCPVVPVALTAMIEGVNGTTSPQINFTIDNAHNDFASNPNANVFTSIGLPNTADAQSFDWGLPFFFGRTVFTAIDGKPTPGGTGPYFAF